MAEPKVYVFWDNSNIFISSKYVASRRGESFAEQSIRIQFEGLFHLAHADRPVAKALAVGSIPPELRELWDRLKGSGIDVHLYERGAQSGTEQAIDSCLQVAMLRALADNDEPQVAVLLTGDGAGYDDGVGFHADLERMAKKGWGIEVIAWELSCRKALKEWAQATGVFIPLERYYESVTFVEGGRRSSPLNLTHRATAKPRGYDPVKERRREKALLLSQAASRAQLEAKKKRKGR